MILTIAGKCAFCRAPGEYIDDESAYGWKHSSPACALFKGALSQSPNVTPLPDNEGWEVKRTGDG